MLWTKKCWWASGPSDSCWMRIPRDRSTRLLRPWLRFYWTGPWGFLFRFLWGLLWKSGHVEELFEFDFAQKHPRLVLTHYFFAFHGLTSFLVVFFIIVWGLQHFLCFFKRILQKNCFIQEPCSNFLKNKISQILNFRNTSFFSEWYMKLHNNKICDSSYYYSPISINSFSLNSNSFLYLY